MPFGVGLNITAFPRMASGAIHIETLRVYYKIRLTLMRAG